MSAPVKLALSVREAADATGYSHDVISRAIKSNDLIARYANSKPVIQVTELEKWLQNLPTVPPRERNK